MKAHLTSACIGLGCIAGLQGFQKPSDTLMSAIQSCDARTFICLGTLGRLRFFLAAFRAPLVLHSAYETFRLSL